MAKVILVMDKPEICKKCPLLESLYDVCLAEGKYVEDCEAKPNWCPLKSLPKKRDGHFTYDEYGDGWDAGFNACIDEILKEEKWV